MIKRFFQNFRAKIGTYVIVAALIIVPTVVAIDLDFKKFEQVANTLDGRLLEGGFKDVTGMFNMDSAYDITYEKESLVIYKLHVGNMNLKIYTPLLKLGVYDEKLKSMGIMRDTEGRDEIFWFGVPGKPDSTPLPEVVTR